MNCHYWGDEVPKMPLIGLRIVTGDFDATIEDISLFRVPLYRDHYCTWFGTANPSMMTSFWFILVIRSLGRRKPDISLRPDIVPPRHCRDARSMV